MTDKRFPLCERLGLHVWRSQLDKSNDTWTPNYVKADDLERILEKAHRVVAVDDIECGPTSWHLPEFQPKHLRGQMDMQALVIAIEPIGKPVTKSVIESYLSTCRPGFKEDAMAFKECLEKILEHGLEREKEREGL